MKKIQFGILTFLILPLLLSACTVGFTNDSSSMDSSLSEGSLSTKKQLIGGKLIDIEDHSLGAIGLYNGQLILERSEQNVSENGEHLDTGNHFYYVLDMKSEQTHEIGRLDYFSVSAGNFIIMKDNYMYHTALAGNPPGQQFLGFDLNGGETKVIEYNTNNLLPFQFLSQLNDEEIIINGYRMLDENEELVEYYIGKYNIRTSRYDELVTVNHNYSTGTGKSLSMVRCSDNKIYTHISEATEQGSMTRRIEVYDSNGILLETLSIQNVISKLSNLSSDNIWRMHIYNDYYFFGTMNGNTLIYKRENSELKEVEILEGFWTIFSIGNQNKIPDYVYLVESYATEIRMFDTKNEELHTLEINVDEQCEYLDGFTVDDSGNILLKVSSSPEYDENAIIKHFYFTADEIKALLAE